MTLLYRAVLIQERNLDKFNISGDQNRALSKRVAMQGIYFSGAYFLTWMFWYVFIMMNTFFDAEPLVPRSHIHNQVVKALRGQKDRNQNQ